MDDEEGEDAGEEGALTQRRAAPAQVLAGTAVMRKIQPAERFKGKARAARSPATVQNRSSGRTAWRPLVRDR